MTSGEIQRLQARQAERGVTGAPLTAADCIPGSADARYEGQIVVIRPEKLAGFARNANHQLMLALYGSGCNPVTKGSAVFCIAIMTGETTRWERTDVAGIILPERIPAWARQRLEAIAFNDDFDGDQMEVPHA